MAVLPGIVIPAETLHHAEALEEATAKIHAAVREAQEAQALLEAALLPFTVDEVGECRDVRRIGLSLESLGRFAEAVEEDGRDIARALGKGSA